MDIRLFINDFQVDLNPDEKIGYTKQVNNIQSMSDRQANFSKSFKVPKTARNIQYFKGLGISGSTSDIPYQRNTSRLFVGNLCLIYKGWANVMETSEDHYEINTYDGNIDFLKLLDNLKFDEIPMPELQHTKDLQTILDTWNGVINDFGYFIADYNGKIFYQDNGSQHLNIDYMIPNVQCKFLWEKIFAFLGFQFEMQAYTDYQFTDNYLTFPKGIRTGEVGEKQVEIDFPEQAVSFNVPYADWLMREFHEYEIDLTSGQITGHPDNNTYELWKAPEKGFYELNFTGSLRSKARRGVNSYLYYAKNMDSEALRSYKPSVEECRANDTLIAFGNEDEFEIRYPIEMEEGDTITFFYDKTADANSDNSRFSMNVIINKIDQTELGQGDFFKGFTPKDFFREILWRFGLTPYTVKDEDKIDFLTWDERINGQIEDWSDRFQEDLGETYAYENYAKENWLRYKYDDDAEDFNDGRFIISNANLDESRDVIQSKTYSREKGEYKLEVPSASLQNVFVPVLKLWSQELKNNNGNPEIEYKSLDSRYIFIHRFTKTINNTRIGSEQLGVSGTANKLQFATTRSDDSMQRMIRKYYTPFLTLLNRTKIRKAIFRMNVFEFDAFDLKPRIYVKQYGAEFIVNKLTKNDLTSDFVTAELIQINR
ncbi:hypothetical protein [uncultured Christiangramia sp.]|uniref:hypothetical protein n=1 Tax=uncultured Christiangramia sp. TaxID=503836 RepID=UPI0026058B79|nr:hypothetical protein [uncultured Christiangramia sp.]